MTLLDFMIVALAADAIAFAWFYGSVFDRPRNYFKRMEAISVFSGKRRHWFFGTLFTCPTCLAYHIAFWTVALLWVPGLFLAEPWQALTRVPLYALAATTIVHYSLQVRPLESVPPEETDEQAAIENDDSGSA